MLIASGDVRDTDFLFHKLCVAISAVEMVFRFFKSVKTQNSIHLNFIVTSPNLMIFFWGGGI